MKKQPAAVIAALSIALMLTACNNEKDPGGGNSSVAESTNSTQSQTPAVPSSLNIERAPADPPAGNPTKIEGPDGSPIYTSEFTTYTDKNGEAAEYSDDNLGNAICDGFAYIAPPGELCLTSIDNADVYNEETLSFAGVPETKLQDYVRVNVGDKVNGLTVQSAQTVFFDDEMSTSEFPAAKYLSGCEVTFQGEMELNGYAVAVKEDNYGVQAGDILFVPQGECDLPVMSFKSDNEIGLYHNYYTGSNYGLTWVNGYGQFCLGNTQTTVADVSCLPTDGTFAKVKVVINNITLTSSKDWVDIIQANIVSIKPN